MSMITQDHILVVGATDIAGSLQDQLSLEEVQVTTILDGRMVSELAKKHDFSLIVLDRMLPCTDGILILKELKSNALTSSIPVIMITIKGLQLDRIAALEEGAVDCITKPFNTKELILRIKRQLALIQKHKAPHLIKASGITLNKNTLTLTDKKKETLLTITEFKLLSKFCEQPNQILSRKDLLESVWGYPDGSRSRTLDTHIKRIRAKLNEELAPKLVAVRGKGYVFQIKSSS